ncbi:SDR family NAD(P)-dependent oxidoreductase [Rhodococcus sp. NPDC019627]|uniref:SDR family NAD(P)-dependent oxidoreductase n=1 Tax=unclassified Rhodococcus (in: high G+C Gram-positive bacteria) TaxID=192944 RepID=UPI0034110A11
MNQEHSGKVVIVTGGASGIGEATVWKLLENGFRVVIADVDEEGSAELVDKATDAGWGATVHAIPVDVRSFEDVQQLVTGTVERFGQLDVMFNNAGIGVGRPLIEHDPTRDYDPVIAINQTGVYHGILAAARQFVRQKSGGVIINTASIYGYSAADLVFTYSASKAAVISFTRSAAFELAPYDIRVVAVAPGRVRTPILSQFTEEQNRIFAAEQLRDRLTEPSEIADVVAFLASSESNAINGTVVNAEDGYSVFKNRF